MEELLSCFLPSLNSRFKTDGSILRDSPCFPANLYLEYEILLSPFQ